MMMKEPTYKGSVKKLTITIPEKTGQCATNCTLNLLITLDHQA